MKTGLVGITGGIGSGKSLCADIFKQLGVPVFNSDTVAKEIMVNDLHVIQQIKELFGDAAYDSEGELNRSFLSQQIFSNSERLQQMNQIVHPAVRENFAIWVRSHDGSQYVIQESALLIETGSYRLFDQLIVVDAPENVRIRRVMNRDKISKKEVVQRISKQLDQDQKLALANHIIVNNGRQGLMKQIIEIHLALQTFFSDVSHG